VIKSEILIVFADFYDNHPKNQILAENSSVNAYKEYGFDVIHVVAANDIPFVSHERLGNSHFLIKRPNTGYDFGSWGEATNLSEIMSKYKYAIFTNSSLLGPITNPEKFFEVLLCLESDIKAAVESLQIKPHFQSYLWAIELNNRNFVRVTEFLKSFIGQPPNRKEIIHKGELGIIEFLNKNGITYKTVFPVGSLCDYNDNPILDADLRLLNHGFPYIKELHLRKNMKNPKYAAFSANSDLGKWNNTISPLPTDPSV
jgi:hypothetical protein